MEFWGCCAELNVCIRVETRSCYLVVRKTSQDNTVCNLFISSLMKWNREKDEELLSAVKNFTCNGRTQWDPIQKQMGIGVSALKSHYRKLS